MKGYFGAGEEHHDPDGGNCQKARRQLGEPWQTFSQNVHNDLLINLASIEIKNQFIYL